MNSPEILKQKTYKLNFECPICGNNKLRQIELSSISKSEEEQLFLQGNFQPLVSVKSECTRCGFEPPHIKRDLFQWLLKKGMLEEIKIETT